MANSFEGLSHVGNLGMGLLFEYRNKGFGSHLLSGTIEHAQSQNGIEKVELEVYESNISAIILYEKYGFIKEGRKEKYEKGKLSIYILFPTTEED